MDSTVLPFDYLREYNAHEDEILETVRRVLASGKLLLGPETEALEAELADRFQVPHAVAVASGTMALQLSLMALDLKPGDEVITVANTCSPTVASFRLTGAVPVFVDVDPRTLMMNPEHLETALSQRTRAILPVHLWGASPAMEPIMGFADSNGLPVVEDCAQSFGTSWDGRPTGTLGRFGCFSFYPTKNLGSYGDAGAILARKEDDAARLRRLRMYGYQDAAVSEEIGTNGRISEIQAALLRWKLGRVDQAIERRRAIAKRYRSNINHPEVTCPAVPPECEPSFHQFVLRCSRRDRLRQHLQDAGIVALIHYPTPLHEMPAYRGSRCVPEGLPETVDACGSVLSLPIHENLEDAEVERVIRVVNAFSS